MVHEEECSIEKKIKIEKVWRFRDAETIFAADTAEKIHKRRWRALEKDKPNGNWFGPLITHQMAFITGGETLINVMARRTTSC